MIKRLIHFVFDHWLLKLLSLLLAVLMWYGVARDPVAEISLSIPVEFTRPPNELDYSTDMLPQAQVRLRGPARVLRELAQENVHVAVDLSKATVGEHTYDLNIGEIRVPHDVEVMQITPNRLRLLFDQRAARQVPIKPRLIGSLPQGYRVAEAIVQPATLTIVGPMHRVIAVDSALTDAIDVSGTLGSTTFDSTAYLPDPTLHVEGSSHVRVLVKITSSKVGVP